MKRKLAYCCALAMLLQAAVPVHAEEVQWGTAEYEEEYEEASAIFEDTETTEDIEQPVETDDAQEDIFLEIESEDNEESAANVPNGANETKTVDVVNSTNATIYAVDEADREYLPDGIPSQYPTSLQILADGKMVALTWKSENDKIAYVDEQGYIQAGTDATYDTPVKLSADYGGKTLEITVTVKDYADIYVYETVDTYIAENITDDMTEYQKVEAICKYVASYNYSVYASSMRGMILLGGGDCWASTTMVNYMCQKVGIQAKTRANANMDSGAGSGHVNSFVVIDGKTYIVDVGFTGKVPRYYSIREVVDPYRTLRKDDGTLKITLYDGLEEDVVIPSEINGRQVTEIGDRAFSRHSEMRSVQIPDSITTIGAVAFAYNSALQEVRIPDSVTVMGDAVFYGCDGLQQITFPKSMENIPVQTCAGCETLTKIVFPANVKTIGMEAFTRTGLSALQIPDTVESIGQSAFSNCEQLKTVMVGPEVKNIGQQAFEYCKELDTISLTDGLETIDEYAFRFCQKLESVTIPKTVTQIASTAFYATDGLQKITVAAGNSAYSSADGVLYDAAKTELILFPAKKEQEQFCIPETVEKIDQAFYSVEGVKDIVIPASVKEIDDMAFAYMRAERIFFEGELPTIGETAFYRASVRGFYPEAEGWTTDALIGYGGYITWYSSDMSNVGISVYPKEPSYNGKPQEAECYVGSGVYSMVEGRDFVVEYQNNVNAGEATVLIRGIGGFTGTKTEKFSIDPRYIDDCEITLSEEDVEYDGAAKEPTVTIKVGEKVMQKDVDYTVTYVRNIEPGTAKVEITGIGNLYGKTYRSFVIRSNELWKEKHKDTEITPGNIPNTDPVWEEIWNRLSGNQGNTSAHKNTGIADTEQTLHSPTKTTKNLSGRSDKFREPEKVSVKPASTKISSVKRKGTKVTIKWKKVSGIDGYEIQYSTDKKFRKNAKTVSVKGASKTSKKIAKLKKGKKYFVRIRSYQTKKGIKMYSKWSAKKTVKK